MNSASPENILDHIRQELKKPLPGMASQNKMAPALKRLLKMPGALQRGSVLILLYPDNNELFTVFIKRATDNTPHSGQISFPGGRLERVDTSIRETALREAEEEVGVPAADVEIIGRLTALRIDISNIEVTPFVGVCKKRPDFKPDPTEVDYVIEARISELLNNEIIQHKPVLWGQNDFIAPVYNIRENYIWGATAMILSEFLDVIEQIGTVP